MKHFLGVALLGAVLLVVSVSCSKQKQESSTMEKISFGKTREGVEAYLYTLRNKNGMEARITNYGGIVVSLIVPDRNGKLGDVALGFDSLSGYLHGSPYIGALIGRYGNRIGKGKFTLNGSAYTLATNNGANALHGGVKGFDKVVWTVDEKTSIPGKSLSLTYVSKDGEEGYPGTLTAHVVYSVTDDNELKIEYTATTDKPTIVNLTQHSYFNLAGAGSGSILNHELFIDAYKFTPIDAGLIPTGELQSVKGTPMDFTTPTAIGARIDQKDAQLKDGLGYDHNWVLNKPFNSMGLAARVYEKTTGRIMEVRTTEPGLQFYSGNFLDGSLTGKGGSKYGKRDGFCLETQHFPDSPNKPNFPTTTLLPGQTLTSTTIYKFSAK
ncbi:MAG TPA: aldose epimerase family protein [Bacteroidota bacterium]|nr:aldose epimerase family protein [Bacteroidota bacterium]